MKKALLTALMITLSFTICLSQTGKITVSQWGFKIQMNSDNQYLKVTDVVTGSLAQLSGLRINDKIIQINEKNVFGIDDPTTLINEYSGQYLNLKINRLDKPFDLRIPLVHRTTNLDEFVTEGELYLQMLLFRDQSTSGYNDYSIKLSFLSDNEREMFNYKTYDFEYTSADNPLLEKKIFEELGNQLNNLGMSRSVTNPDLIILLNYYSGTRENYVPPQQIISTRIEKSYNWFWGPMQVPITESKTTSGYTTVTYLLTSTLKFLDANEIKSNKLPPVIWQGTFTEKSGDELLIINECRRIFELLLYQFPQVSIDTPEEFLCPMYFYTGIVYNKDDIRTIYDVVPDSPASEAGMLKGDVIVSIRGDKIPSNYVTCVKYEYVNAIQDGYEKKYEDYIKYAEKAGYGLRYLVYFQSMENRAITININRKGKKMSFDIIPEKRQLFKIQR